MVGRNKRRRHARFELVTALRVAALNIADAEHRRIAARNAESISKCFPERYGKGWGEVAAQGRAILRTLPDLKPEAFAETAAILRQCADVVQHGAAVESETNLYDRSRGRRRA